MKNSKKTWECTREIVFERLDRRMREDKLYLDYSMTLPKLSEMTWPTYRRKMQWSRKEVIRMSLQTVTVSGPEGVWTGFL